MLDVKYSSIAKIPFHHMKVRIKGEIVMLGVEDIESLQRRYYDNSLQRRCYDNAANLKHASLRFRYDCDGHTQ